MVILVISYFIKKRKIWGEILLCHMIQRKTNFFDIFHCTWSTWKNTQKYCGRKDSELNLSHNRRWGGFNSTDHEKCVILKAGEIKISTNIFDTKSCAAMLGRILTGTTALVENRDRYQFLGYSQLNHYLYAYLKLLKNQRDTG